MPLTGQLRPQILQGSHESLEQKVEQRTYDLRLKTIELENSNLELENRNAALSTSYRKLEDLVSEKDSALNLIFNLKANNFDNLQKTILKIGAVPAGEREFLLGSAVKEINRIGDVLDPFVQKYQAEKSISSKSVLLVENDVKQQMVAKMALGGTGLKLTIAKSKEEAINCLNDSGFDIVCTNGEFLDLTELAKAKYPQTKVVFMTSENPDQYLEKVKKYPYLSNIVSRSQTDKIFTVKNMMTTVNKLLTNDIFGLEKYLSWGVEVNEEVVESSTNRSEIVDKVADYLQNLGVSGFLNQRCKLISEELLSNAIFDAPTDHNGKPLFNFQDRKIPVKLAKGQQARFRYACDGVLIALSAEDPFGSLKRQTVLNYLDSCYKSEVADEHEGKGGGGLGLFTIMRSADLIVFNIRENLRTEVIALLNVKKITEQSTNLNSFQFFLDKN